MSPRRRESGRARVALILLGFALLFVGLAVNASVRTSATWDEPMHVMYGYSMLKLGDYRLGTPGHPPLIRQWAAIPLVLDPSVRMDTSTPAYVQGRQLVASIEFLYRDNDADSLLHRARFMIVLLTVALGVLLFLWARDLYGLAAATAVLGLFCLDPNVLAHGSLVTTDMGFTLFFFGAGFALWRAVRILTPWNALALAACVSLAQVSKYSAILLAPVILLVLLARAVAPDPWPWRSRAAGALATRRARLLAAGVMLLALLLVSWGTIWAAYGFRFAAHGDERALLNEYEGDPRQERGNPAVVAVMKELHRRRLLPDALVQGFLYTLGTDQKDRYFGGRFFEERLWWFYPAVFLLKAPSALLVLLLAALVLGLRRRGPPWWERLAAAAPPALYLATAIASPLNTSLRHILPAYPFLILAAGLPLRRLMAGRGRVWAAALAALLLTEFAVIYPDNIAAFNFLAGGPARGHRWLLDANLDWGQDLKGLAKWMKRRGVAWINLNYFGTAAPEYYGIDANHIVGSSRPPRPPRLPGYVAVSLTNLHSFYSGREVREFYRPLLERAPEAVIGRSIHVYRVESPWWPSPAGRSPSP